jgi:integrase
MAILPPTEKQGGPAQPGGWHKDMARRRYQKGSIRKRGKRNPVWELQWWEDYIKEDGKIGRRRQSVTLGAVAEITLRQARKLGDEQVRPINQGILVPQSTMKFWDFVERYLVPLFFPTLKASTQKRYRQTLTLHLLPAFGKSRLCDIGTIDLQRFVLQKMESGLSWESANHFRNLMSKAFEMARMWGFHSAGNPARGVSLPEKRPVREKQALQPNQILHLLTLLREPARTLVLLGVLTGMRIGEILGLRRKDVNFAIGQLQIEQACYRGLLGSPKTKGSRRTLPLPTALVGALIQIYERAPRVAEDDLVFQTRNGTPLNDTNLLHHHLKPAGWKIGMPSLSWHTLRRTHATLLQSSGASLKDAQTQLGHSKMSTTLEIYTVPIPAHLRLAVENLAQLVTNGDELPLPGEEVPAVAE